MRSKKIRAIFRPNAGTSANVGNIGHLYQRSKAGFEAFNIDDRSIGLFGSQREAADALSSGAHRMAEIAAGGAVGLTPSHKEITDAT